MSKIVSYLFALALLSASFVLGITSPTFAMSGADCVPKDAWTETIDYPAVTHDVTKVDKAAWEEIIPATPAIWANFSPNRKKGLFVGQPTYPADARGTWHNHNKIPRGHKGDDGVYQRGVGNGDWFYRHNATAEKVIGHPAETHQETVIEKAHTDTIVHPAIDCIPVHDSGVIVTHDQVTDYDCGDNFQTVTKITTRVAWESLNGHKTYDVPTITTVENKQPHKVVICNNNDKPHGALPNTGGPNWFLLILGAALLAFGIRTVRMA